MRARLWAVAVTAVVAALVLAWWARPDTGVPSPPPRPAVPLEPRAAPNPSPRPVVPPPAPPVAPRPRPPSPERAATNPPDTEGIASAMVAREADIQACLDAEAEAGRPLLGRPSLRVTVYARDGVGRAAVTLAHTSTHRAEAEACLTAAFADARFDPPDGERSVVWAIPD